MGRQHNNKTRQTQLSQQDSQPTDRTHARHCCCAAYLSTVVHGILVGAVVAAEFRRHAVLVNQLVAHDAVVPVVGVAVHVLRARGGLRPFQLVQVESVVSAASLVLRESI